MKTLKFSDDLVPLVLSGRKTATWRMFDDKDLQVGDDLLLVNSDTREPFGQAKIVEVREKPLNQIREEDFEGHETYEGVDKMFEMYRGYYGERVTPESIVKMVTFKLL